MSMCDEHAEEIEVLTSIYPEEFELISESPAPSFKIHLAPPDVDEVFVAVSLVCELPTTYPDEIAPILSIKIEKGLGDVHADELKALADEIATENIGMPSIFTVAEAVKEWLIDNNVAGQDGSMYSEMMRKQQQKSIVEKKSNERAALKEAADSEQKEGDQLDPEELERIRKRQAGTMCTIETFNKWKQGFDEEMRLKKLEETKDNADLDFSRPTGKQFFLANKGAMDDDDDLINAAEGEIHDEQGEGEHSDEDDEDYMEGDDDDSDYEDS